MDQFCERARISGPPCPLIVTDEYGFSAGMRTLNACGCLCANRRCAYENHSMIARVSRCLNERGTRWRGCAMSHCVRRASLGLPGECLFVAHRVCRRPDWRRRRTRIHLQIESRRPFDLYPSSSANGLCALRHRRPIVQCSSASMNSIGLKYACSLFDRVP